MRRYLFVDDNAAFADNLAEIVRETDADVMTAKSGAHALELVRSHRFDALVTDMRMPVMNGAALVHEIRRVDPGLPAIVLTAYTSENDLLAARQEGLLAVLAKPPDLARLLHDLKVARRDALVALIEDDLALSDNLCEALRDRGFSAVTTASVTGTDRLGVRPFAALVDLRVPGGPDGAAMQRLTDKFPGVPTLVITALPHAQGEHVFQKPFDTAALLDTLEALHGTGA